MRGLASLRAVALLAVLCYTAAALNNRPVIGILDQPKSGKPGKTYIAASYVKFIESSGGRVVPIHFKQSAQELKQLARSLNGILFPGGSTDLVPGEPFYEAVHTLYQEVMTLNKAGVHVPLWGTCMGFQIISVLAASDASVLEGNFDSWNYPIPLNFTDDTKSSRMLAGASPSLLTTLSTLPVTMNNHHFGVRPQVWDSSSKLTSLFNVLATNRDRNARSFISMFEGKTLPIYGVQWHPEKNNFEWVKEDIPHSAEAVEIAQYFGNFLVNEARKNNQAFPNGEKELQKHLIYNFPATYTGTEADASFEQIYLFDK